MSMRWVAFAAFSAFCLACGGSSTSSGGGAVDIDAGVSDAGSSIPHIITISNFMFSPTNLTVPPGATVTVVNKDSAPHSVTSQSAPGKLTFGSVAGVSFDTGAFTGTTTFTLPANAPEGTVVPYFCTVHRQHMANSGQITISSTGAGGGAEGGMGDGATSNGG